MATNNYRGSQFSAGSSSSSTQQGAGLRHLPSILALCPHCGGREMVEMADLDLRCCVNCRKEV